MHNKIKSWIWIVITIVMGLMIIFWPRTIEYTYEPGVKPIRNPLKGWVRWGENQENIQDTALAYVGVYWSELEKEKGVYDFDALEQQWNFQFWKEQGVHLILRVIADEPGEEAHMNIPQWLFEEMEGSGTWYDSSYGKGFSPDYTHPAMVEAHSGLLKALGERYDEHPQIAYIQLGSLGHWGEWHVNTEAGIEQFPTLEIAEQYVKHYVDAFDTTPLLMRRPYPMVEEYNLGLYNDSLGLRKSDERFLSWITEGYISDQTGESLPGCPEFWKEGPSGGELGSGMDMEQYFTKEYDNLLDMIQKSHISWIGPKSPKREELSDIAQKHMDSISAELGYCYTVSKVKATKTLMGDRRVQVEFQNLGVAPMYASWPIRFELRNENGDVIAGCEVLSDQSQWLEKGRVNCQLEVQERSEEALFLWVGIIDPMTGGCRVALANDLPSLDGMYCLGEV